MNTSRNLLIGFAPLSALLLSLLFINSLQFSLHDSTEWNLADALTAEFRMIKAQRHQLRTDLAAADVIGALPLARSRVLHDSLHLLTSGCGASCPLSTVERMNQRHETSVDGFFPRTDVSDALLMLVCILHHFRNHYLQVAGIGFAAALRKENIEFN